MPKGCFHSTLVSFKMKALADYFKECNIIVIVVVYMSFFLDNVLLTVVVPIIPDYLFSNDLNTTKYINGTAVLGPISLSPLQRQFEAFENDNGPLGVLLASKAFVQLAFTPLTGYLIGILGCYLPLFLGSCNMLIASLLFAYGNTYGLLVLARALHGSSSAAIAVSGMCILAKNVPKHLRNRVMPLAFGGIALGVLIGYPLGGAANQILGKSAPFLLIAFLIVISIGLQLYFLRGNDVEAVLDEEPADCLDWIKLLKDNQTLIATSAICICTSSMAVLEPCVPLWILAHFKPVPTRWQLGAVFIPDSIGYFIGSHFAGFLPVDFWRVALSAMVITGLSCCALPLASNISQLTFPHFGLGLGVGVVDAALVPFLADLVDTKQGKNQYGPVYALQQFSVSLAYSFGPLVAGQVVHIISFPWLIRCVGFLNLIFCPLLLEFEDGKDDEEKYMSALLGEPPVSSYSSLDDSYSLMEGEEYPKENEQ